MKLDNKVYEEKIEKLLNSIEIPFKNIGHYCLAFVHRSVLNENIGDFKESNERLEFLGDAILELVITEMLFKKFPDYTEGQLTDIRSAVVRGQNLAKIASELGFFNYLVLSKGEVLAGGNENPYILANTLEAFLGAIYIDLGIDYSRIFIEKYVFSTLEEILEKKLYVDAKSYFQEISQEKLGTTPTYEVLRDFGEDHDKTYIIGAFVGDKQVGTGEGSSKKKAQQKAAENAIEKLDEWINQ
ncbi:MAG: ribonuclease III [Candidatus Gracilibacteria bacterium]|nr:ribonuclease III [Candidatus Gracilibacteria bacterium]MDD3119790.1 ribonuclease III [Candidatus Gracilibacteria bacterium]MDD4530191.1 ribonuclease III [Candidatus Gracilibacteria bacterium]